MCADWVTLPRRMDSLESAQGSPLASLPSKSLPQVGNPGVLLGGEVHFLFPFPFPQQWGDPEAFTVGFSTRLRPGTTSSFLSVRGVERAGPARKTPGLKAGELRTGAWRARRPGEAAARNCEAGEGFPQDCLGLGEAGSRQDGVPEGGERHTTTQIRLLPGRDLRLFPEGRPLTEIPQTAAHARPRRPSHSCCGEACRVSVGTHPRRLHKWFSSI